MNIYRLQCAYLPHGWARDVLVTVSDRMITAIDTGTAATPQPAGIAIERLDGIVVPGMPNAHSHAFQRAMAGNAEYRVSARDSFWTWRHAMYALANRVSNHKTCRLWQPNCSSKCSNPATPPVAEFHYLHQPRGGGRYSSENLLWDAVSDAARTAGIGLTFLPTLYQSSDFGEQPLKPEQARFFLDTDEFLRAVDRRIAAEGRASNRMLHTGAAFHSLRAVPLPRLRETALGVARH